MGIHMIKRASAVFAAAALALTGCSGEDGDPGASCTIDSSTNTLTCPDGTTTVLPAPPVAGKVLVSDVVASNAGADVVVTYNVTQNGVPSGAFTVKEGGYTSAGATSATKIRGSLAPADYTVTAGANGSYETRIRGKATATPTTYMFNLGNGTGAVATVVAHPNGKPKSTVGDQACINCHGDVVFRDGHHDANAQGAGACVVCHVRADREETRLGTRATITNGAITDPGTAPGTRLMGYVHGIHNSHNMPDGVYSRNGSTEESNQFSIGFPSYMNNCSTCHDTQENLDLVLSKPVSFQTCISCHDGWDGFGGATFGGVSHTIFTASTDCGQCHNGAIARATVGDFHGKRQAYTPRNGLLYDGKDQSFEFGKRVAMTVDSVSYSGENLVVTWSATLDGAPVDPCNTNVGAGPVFMDFNGAGTGGTTVLTGDAAGRSTSNLSFLQSYATGNDWTGEGIAPATSAGAIGVGTPGQPVTSPTLRTVDFTPAPTATTPTPATQPANTVCAANVATSTIPIALGAPTSSGKGILGLQGKPQVTFTSGEYTRVIQVRSPSPVREFVVGTGAEPTDKRRAIADTAKCLTCHQGSMYQHGGNRVDSVDLCVICHNPAANEKNVRVGLGVTASEAYDGKPGQTYDFRYMLHAIHSAGETNAPLVYYRSNGIYAFGSQAAIDALPNWPGSGTQAIFGADTATNRTHNEIVVHYPRGLNECGACHTGNAVALPSTTRAVAVTTYDAGGSPWRIQTDDVLMSPATASCMSCHQSGDAGMQNALRGHAFQNSWTPAVFTGGRQNILGGGASESCLLCHGAGRVSDFNAKHGN
jgi:OmcA/MtrC family decaheme c-type cytochrome